MGVPPPRDIGRVFAKCLIFDEVFLWFTYQYVRMHPIHYMVKRYWLVQKWALLRNRWFKQRLPICAFSGLLIGWWLKPPGGGHSLKLCDGYVRPHWPLFSNRLSLNDPLFISHMLLSPSDPHFQNALSLNDPLFKKYLSVKMGVMLSLNDAHQ